MNYGGINKSDIVNGPGWRVSLFVSGCSNKCLGCQNQEAQNFDYGEEFTQEEFDYILKNLQRKQIRGLSISGGDPLWQNVEGLKILTELCKETHKLNKDVWFWTGFTWEEIFDPNLNNTIWKYCRELIYNCDVVVDGRFELDKRNIALEWKGSSNQRVIDVKQTLQKGEIVLWKEQN